MPFIENQRTQDIREQLRKEERLRQYRYQQKWSAALPNPSEETFHSQKTERLNEFSEETARLAKGYWLICDILLHDRSEGTNEIEITLPYPYRDDKESGGSAWEYMSRILVSHMPAVTWEKTDLPDNFSEDYSHRISKDRIPDEATLRFMIKKQQNDMHLILSTKESKGYMIVSQDGSLTTTQEYRKEYAPDYKRDVMHELMYVLKEALVIDEDETTEEQFSIVTDTPQEEKPLAKIIVLFPDHESEE